MLKRMVIVVLALIGLTYIGFLGLGSGWFGRHEDPGKIEGAAVPEKVLKMPACDPRDPSVIPHDATPYLKLAPQTRSVSVELTYRDGSVSEIKSFRR